MRFATVPAVAALIAGALAAARSGGSPDASPGP